MSATQPDLMVGVEDAGNCRLSCTGLQSIAVWGAGAATGEKVTGN